MVEACCFLLLASLLVASFSKWSDDRFAGGFALLAGAALLTMTFSDVFFTFTSDNLDCAGVC